MHSNRQTDWKTCQYHGQGTTYHLSTATCALRWGKADEGPPTIPRTPTFCSSSKTASGKLVHKWLRGQNHSQYRISLGKPVQASKIHNFWRLRALNKAHLCLRVCLRLCVCMRVCTCVCACMCVPKYLCVGVCVGVCVGMYVFLCEWALMHFSSFVKIWLSFDKSDSLLTNKSGNMTHIMLERLLDCGWGFGVGCRVPICKSEWLWRWCSTVW